MFIIYGHNSHYTWVVDAQENEIQAYASADKAKAKNPEYSYTVERIR